MDANASSAARERSPDSQSLDFRTRAKLIRDAVGFTLAERSVMAAVNAFLRGSEAWCWPSLRKLALKARLTIRGTQKILRRLELAGVVERQSNEDRGSGRTLSNHFRIDWTSVTANAVQGRTPFRGEGERGSPYEGERRSGGRVNAVQGGQHLTPLRVVGCDDDAPRAGRNLSFCSNTHKAPAAGVCVDFLSRFYAELARADGPLFVPAPTAQEIEVAEEVLRQLGPDAALAAIPRVLDRVRRQWPDCRRFAGTVSFWNDVIAADRRRRDAAAREAEARRATIAATERAAADAAKRCQLKAEFDRLTPGALRELETRAIAQHAHLARNPGALAIMAFLLFCEDRSQEALEASS